MLALTILGKLFIVSKLLARSTFNEVVVPMDPSIVLILLGFACWVRGVIVGLVALA